jgi:hypothetical protein
MANAAAGVWENFRVAKRTIPLFAIDIGLVRAVNCQKRQEHPGTHPGTLVYTHLGDL